LAFAAAAWAEHEDRRVQHSVVGDRTSDRRDQLVSGMFLADHVV
jgi:hypothetical protein